MLGLKLVPIIVIQFHFEIKMIILRQARGNSITIKLFSFKGNHCNDDRVYTK